MHLLHETGGKRLGAGLEEDVVRKSVSFASDDVASSDRVSDDDLLDWHDAGQRVVEMFHRLAAKQRLNVTEQVYKCRAVEHVADHLARQLHYADGGTKSRGMQTKGPRLPTARELMSDAERILHKNGSGMSLYERLTRDM